MDEYRYVTGAKGTPRDSRRRHAPHPEYSLLTLCRVRRRTISDRRMFWQVPAADQCAACRRLLDAQRS